MNQPLLDPNLLLDLPLDVLDLVELLLSRLHFDLLDLFSDPWNFCSNDELPVLGKHSFDVDMSAELY